MAIFNFLENSAKLVAEKTAQEVNASLSKHMQGYFTEINERLRRIETRQKETNLQIEEIDNYLQSEDDENVFIAALIALADIIEDFYHFAAGDKDSANQGSCNQGSALFEQAQIMWNAAKNKAVEAGLTIIDAEDEPFNFNIHSIKGTAWDDSLPAGYVIKILKCGYIFKDEIVRHAMVIVNKEENTIL
jgi:molecular chaperone GrpE (heat shock protein)